MSFTKISTAALIVVFSFIGVGDRVLPSSIGQYSQNSRSYLFNLLPSVNPKNNNAKTEDAIKNLEQ